MKIEKITNGNVFVRDEAGIIVKSFTPGMYVHTHPRDTNKLIISQDPSGQEYVRGAYVLDKNDVTEIKTTTVTTAWTSAKTRQELVLALATDFFATATSGGGATGGLTDTQLRANPINVSSPSITEADATNTTGAWTWGQLLRGILARLSAALTVNANNNVLQSAGNTSTANLAANATFTGTWDTGNALLSSSAQVMVTSSHNGTLNIDQSQDSAGAVGVQTDSYVVTAGVPFFANVAIIGKAVRVRFVNGATATTSFALTTILTPVMTPTPKSLTHQGNLKCAVVELPSLGVGRTLVTSATATNIVLTASCRSVRIYTDKLVWFSIAGTAVAGAPSHVLADGQGLDFSVPYGTTISVIQGSASGTFYVSELV